MNGPEKGSIEAKNGHRGVCAVALHEPRQVLGHRAALVACLLAALTGIAALVLSYLS